MASFAFYGMLAAIVLLLFAIFAKYKGGTKWFKATIKKKVITFGTPHRVELIILSFFIGIFFLAEILNNKLLVLGANYRVSLFWNTTISAMLLWQISLVIFLCLSVALFLLSLKSKQTNRIFDIFVAIIGLFGFALLMSGVYLQMYATNVYFFTTIQPPINVYHVGVYAQLFVAIYHTFTL